MSQYDAEDIAHAYRVDRDGACPPVKIKFPEWAPLTEVEGGSVTEADAEVADVEGDPIAPYSIVTVQVQRSGRWQDVSQMTYVGAKQHINRAVAALWRAVDVRGNVLIEPRGR